MATYPEALNRTQKDVLLLDIKPRAFISVHPLERQVNSTTYQASKSIHTTYDTYVPCKNRKGVRALEQRLLLCYYSATNRPLTPNRAVVYSSDARLPTM